MLAPRQRVIEWRCFIASIESAYDDLIASLETFGGVLLVIGLFVRPVAFAMVIFMLFAVHYTTVNSGFIWFRCGCEYSLTILFISFYYLINGAGPLSVDRKRGREF